MAEARQPIESGVPDPMPWMHPALRKNYGKWKWHDRPRHGVLHHVAESGDEVWTVKAGTCRQLDVYTIRKLCDIADEFCGGFIRFTTRSNAEFMVTDETRVEPLIARLNKDGFPVGAPALDLAARHIPGLAALRNPGHDASGVVRR
jgi:sulfite reductase beta subunit